MAAPKRWFHIPKTLISYSGNVAFIFRKGWFGVPMPLIWRPGNVCFMHRKRYLYIPGNADSTSPKTLAWHPENVCFMHRKRCFYIPTTLIWRPGNDDFASRKRLHHAPETLPLYAGRVAFAFRNVAFIFRKRWFRLPITLLSFFHVFTWFCLLETPVSRDFTSRERLFLRDFCLPITSVLRDSPSRTL